jgi:hypothetical protein
MTAAETAVADTTFVERPHTASMLEPEPGALATPADPDTVKKAVLALGDSDLATLGNDVQLRIRQLSEQHARAIDPHLTMIALIKEELARRIAAAHGGDEKLDEQKGKTVVALADPDLQIELVIERELVKRISDLQAIQHHVSPDEYAKAIYPEPPPKETPMVADARVLKGMLTRYGAESAVGKIIARGLRYIEKRRYVRIAERVKAQPEVNVTPGGAT